MGFENPFHLLFVAVIALVVLGPRRLPELARAAGKSMREFREALSGNTEEPEPELESEQDSPPLVDR
jgi:sec-independent protein translocase protein TatA